MKAFFLKVGWFPWIQCIFISVITSKLNVVYSLATQTIFSHINKILLSYLSTFSCLLCLVYLLPVIMISWYLWKSHICFCFFIVFQWIYLLSASGVNKICKQQKIILWKKKKLIKEFHNFNSHIMAITTPLLPVTVYLPLLFGAGILHISHYLIHTII